MKVEAVTLVVVVGLAGVAGFGALASGFETAIDERARASVAASTKSQLGSRSEAVIGALSELANLARGRLAELPSEFSRPNAYREAVSRAQQDDVHETAARLRDVRGANPSSRALDERLDAIDRVAYGTHAPELEQGLLGTLRRILAGDPASQSHVDAVLKDRGQLIDNVKGAPEAWLRWRAAWLTLINHNKQRRLVMQAIEDDARRASDGQWKALKREEGFFDQLTVGGGVLGSHAQGVLSTTHEGPTRLLVDASARPGSDNFLKVGDALRYNQSNRGQTEYGADGRFINELENRALIAPGVVNPADLSFNKWAPARDWADAAAVNLRAAGGDVLSSTKVTGVYRAEAGKPGRYRVALSRGNETVDVYTNRVLITTGLDKEKFSGLDKRSLELIESERAKLDLDDPTKVPLIMGAFDELEMAGTHPSWWDNYAFDPEDPDARIAIIGGGDTTFTVLEQLARTLGAPEVSNLQRAQRGGGKSMGVDLYGGQSLPEEAQQFLLGRSSDTQPRVIQGTSRVRRPWNGLRSRYAGLFGNVVRSEKNMAESSGTGAETTRIRSVNIEKIRITRNGEVEISYKGRVQDPRDLRTVEKEFKRRYKRVILATGVESEAGKLIDSFIPSSSYKGEIQKTNLLDVVDAQGNIIPQSAVGADDRAVARKVPDEEIYFGGLAAGQDLIPESETVGNVQNRVSVALWAERLGRMLRGAQWGESAGIAAPKAQARTTRTIRMLADGEDAITELRETDVPTLTRRMEVELALEDRPDLALKYEFARSLQDAAFDDDAAVPVVGFQWTVNRLGNRTLEIKTNFESDEWVRALKRDERLLGVMRKLARENQPQYIVANTYSKDAARYGFSPGGVRPQSVGIVAGMH